MILSRNKINQILIVICTILYSYFNCFNVGFNLGAGDFTVNLLLFIIAVIFLINLREAVKTNKKNVILFVIQLILLLISFFANNSGYGSVATIILFSTILQLASIIRLNRKTLLLILIINIVFWLYSLTVNYHLLSVNTNGASFIVYYMAVIIISLLSTLLKNKKFKKILIVSTLCITFLNILKYDSRNVMIIILFLLVAGIFDFSSFFSTRKRFKTFISWFMITICSLLFTKLYIALYENNYIIDLSFLSNKTFFTGREILWKNLYLALNNNFMFGIGSKSYLFPTLGTHNYMLNVLVLFGIPHFIMFVVLMYNYIKKFFFNNLEQHNFICFISIVSLFLTDFLEATFVGGIKLYVLFLLSVIYFSDSNKTKSDCQKDQV